MSERAHFALLRLVVVRSTVPRGAPHVRIREVARKNKLWVEKWGFVYGEVSVYVAAVGILRKLRNVRHALVEFRKVRKSPAS